MKKTVLLTLLALFVFVGAASATTTFTSTSGSDLGETNFKCSTNVTLIADGTTAAYAAVAGHTQGDKKYSSDSDSANITEADKTKGTDVATGDVPTVPSS